MNTFKRVFFTLLAGAVMVACTEKEDEIVAPTYQVPATYNFENVSYKGQTVRILLLDTLGKLIDGATSKKVTEEQLKAIFENTNGLFANISSGKRLSDKCESNAKNQIQAWFKEIAALSGTQPANRYLFNANGLDLGEAVKKTIMGSVFYYQAAETYMANLELDDNKNVVPGEGTARAHHWDEAFGYYSAPVDFGTYTDAEATARAKDTNGDGKIDQVTERPYFHAGYSLSRDNGSKAFANAADRTEFRKQLMAAFLKGRAAIVNSDDKAMIDARTAVLAAWEQQIAANALHYIIETQKNANDITKRNHAWAEGKYFANMLKYNSKKKITDAQLTQLNGWLKDAPGTWTNTDVDNAKTLLRTIYGFSEYQLANL